MKVVLIAKSFTKGGAASGARNLRSALISAGIEVVSYDAMSASVPYFIKAQRAIERASERILFGPEIHCIRFFPETFSLCDIYKENLPDIIQLCDISGNTVDLSEVSRVPCPVVHRMSDFWPYHGPDHYSLSFSDSHPLARWFFLKLIRRPDLRNIFRVTPSEWLGGSLKGSFNKKFDFIPNAVHLGVSVRREGVVNPGMITLGFISKLVLDPRKGFLKVLAVLDNLGFTSMRIRLVVFGDIRDTDKLFSSRVDVEYRGEFSRSELSNVYSSFDVLLCPSRIDNSPNVVTEALAHGCPTIGQIGTGMTSYIYPEFGFLHDFWADNQSSSELEAFLEYVHDNYAELSGNALLFVGRNLMPEDIGRRYMRIYSKLIISGRGN